MGVSSRAKLFDTQTTFSITLSAIEAMKIEADEKYSRQQFIWWAKGLRSRSYFCGKRSRTHTFVLVQALHSYLQKNWMGFETTFQKWFSCKKSVSDVMKRSVAQR